MENQNDKQRTQKLALAAILTALVAVLQFLGAFIHIGPFSVSLVLIPIVIGAALCGWQIGAWLGLVFGITVLLSGDASSFLAVSIPGTVGTVLVEHLMLGLFEKTDDTLRALFREAGLTKEKFMAALRQVRYTSSSSAEDAILR